MTATIMDGKSIAMTIRQELKTEAEAWREQGVIPRLDVVLVGNDPASVYYANAKEKISKKIAIEFKLHELPEDTTEDHVLRLIEELNQDKVVHGIMVELPLPKQISREAVMAAVHPLKDVDGVNPLNKGYLASGMDGLFPATPEACIEIMLRSGIDIVGKDAVIVGWGETVGKPLTPMLLKRGATVTACHSKTKDMPAHAKGADIVIVAVGRPGLIKADMIKPGAVVVDVGINETDNGIVGDVEFEAVKEVAGYITPVPGGVGSVTTVLLFRNLLRGMRMQLQ